MLTRRQLLKTMGAAGAGAVLGPSVLGQWGQIAGAQVLPAGVEFDVAPFTLGVGSGYPTTNSVTLWTRLAPEPLLADGGLLDPVQVFWAVGENPDNVRAELDRGETWNAPTRPQGGPLSGVVASGAVTAVPETGHSVHLDVSGLEPGGTYYYGFAAGGAMSTIGRTRTTPDGPTDHLRFAVASCQNFSHGFWAALGHIADEEIDFVLHTGDYIYEGSGGIVRQHVGPALSTPGDYRIRHALYKGDPNLRRAHAMHPWIMTWDDHEIWNNYAGSERPANVDQLRTGGYKAYYEHLPIRLTEEGPPQGPWFRIYQNVVFGDLLDVVLTDTRQYRDVQPCHGEDTPCFETHPYAPGRTILGEAQKVWLKETLASSSAAWRGLVVSTSFNQWQIGGLPQEVNDVPTALGAPLYDKVYFNEDSWDSYNEERQELLQFILDQDIVDVVSLGGEAHRHLWSHVRLDVDNQLSPLVLSHFGGTAISSNSGDPGENDLRAAVYATSLHMRYMDGEGKGYMVCDVNKERWRTTARNIQHSQDPALDARLDPNAIVTDTAVYEVARGNPELTYVSGEEGNPLPG